MALTYYLDDDGITYIPVTEATPLPVGGAGGGDSAGIGSPDDAAWSGTGPASLISIMKAIHTYQQLIAMEVNEIDIDMETVKALLQDIKTNTTPAG